MTVSPQLLNQERDAFIVLLKIKNNRFKICLLTIKRKRTILEAARQRYFWLIDVWEITGVNDSTETKAVRLVPFSATRRQKNETQMCKLYESGLRQSPTTTRNCSHLPWMCPASYVTYNLHVELLPPILLQKQDWDPKKILKLQTSVD